MKPTSYKNINEILKSLECGLRSILGGNLIGIYLTGSLSYGDFNPESSDIDLLVILQDSASQKHRELIKQLHSDIEAKNKKWAKRIECSYIPLDMLESTLPPKSPRPYIGEGIFYPEAPYGNEWLINKYLLYQHGIALFGHDFRKLIPPVDIADVQKACVRDLLKEWQPKITDPTYLQNSHYQSYVVLNLCRILYTVKRKEVTPKKVSAEWVINEFPQWKKLIQTAKNWNYNTEMNLVEETIQFIRFVISKVTNSL